MDRSSKHNINKDIATLNNVLDQMDLTDIQRAFHPEEAKYTFFSNAHRTFSKIDHMTGHKTSVNKFKKPEIISSIFSDHSAMKLEVSHQNIETHTKTWKVSYMSSNNEFVNNKIKEEIKRYLETNENAS